MIGKFGLLLVAPAKHFSTIIRPNSTAFPAPANPEKLRQWLDQMRTKDLKAVQLKTLTRLKFQLDEKDLDEKFIKGFGPGGQKTNKANNCVVMTHLPTGEVVKCHDSREQPTNRAIAKKMLVERLDFFLNQESSTLGMRVYRIERRKIKAEYRRR